jgi:hypothetical protein
MSIWTDTTSRYGTAPDDVKPVSESTARRWINERRTKARRAQSMRFQSPQLARRPLQLIAR